MGNIMGGIGAELDQARQRMPCIDRTFSESVPRETRRIPLAPGTDLRALVHGAPCSLNAREEIQPFDPSQRFAGFVITLLEDLCMKVAVHARGAMLLRVEGLQTTSIGQAVHALAGGRFGLESGAEMGQVLAIENLEKGAAIVGFRRLDDQRPFIMSGRMMERER